MLPQGFPYGMPGYGFSTFASSSAAAGALTAGATVSAASVSTLTPLRITDIPFPHSPSQIPGFGDSGVGATAGSVSGGVNSVDLLGILECRGCGISTFSATSAEIMNLGSHISEVLGKLDDVASDFLEAYLFLIELLLIVLKMNPVVSEEVVLLDGDTPHPESAEEASNNQDAKKLYYPSREHPNSIEISSDDIRCLQPESLLSSPIMNFYIMYLQGPMSLIVRPRGEYHIFNTYFFSKLEAMTSKTCYSKSSRLGTHWSLVIVCMPTKDDQTGPIILHLDSLKFHNSRLIFSVVCRFLKEEWNYLNENGSSAECPLHETVWKNLPRKIEKKPVEPLPMDM
nr:unnamed protein product [Digitaria exilis]